MTTETKAIPALNKLIADLKSRSEDVRARAAKDLRLYVASVAREMSGEHLSKFNDTVDRRIYELVHSSDPSEKMGGIVAIDELIDIDGEENAPKFTRFANYLRIVLPGTGDPAVMAMAAKALGHLALAGGALTSDFVEFEVRRAYEWLDGDRSEARRHAAVLVLVELATNAPTLFYGHAAQFFEAIWVAVRDPKIAIREGAIQALRACLALTAQRESRIRSQWARKVYDEVQKGFKTNKDDGIHGSLLTIGELLRHADEEFVFGKFEELCDTVLRYRDNKNPLIQRSVIVLLPTLAQFRRNEFAESNHMKTAMNFLLSMLRRERERLPAFTSIGQMALAVGPHISPYLDSILSNVKESLGTKGSKKAQVVEAPVFACISMLGQALGNAFAKQAAELLEPMFGVGLAPPLAEALHELARFIPGLLPSIQERLLEMLSNTLARQSYRVPGTPKGVSGRPSSTGRVMAPPVGVLPGAAGSGTEGNDIATTTLALRTLGSFDFSGHVLTQFVRETVVRYLEDENPLVRREAALTCAQLLGRSNERAAGGDKGPPRSIHSAAVVSEVLEKLLAVGITDPDANIRLSVLASLDGRFDSHLAQAENLRSLFVALNDEDFRMRELAVAIIGRLTILNPAYVMPSLRKTLIQLLTDLEFSGVARNKEEAARLLAQLISHAPRLIKPYVDPVLRALKSKLRDPSPGVAANVLAALGELAQVGAEDMARHVNDLLPLIIETLQDQSSVSKREVALRTLGQLAEGTGYVVEPYLQYPKLLHVLLNFLKTEQQPTLRREVIKVLGILGALDPYKHKLSQTALRDHEANFDPSRIGMAGAGGPGAGAAAGPSHEEYYPTVAIAALMRILRDPTLAVHHTMVIQAVMFIFKSLGLKCVPFLPQIMPPFLHVMRSCEPSFREFLFQQLGGLVSIVKQHIRNYLSEIFVLVQDYWDVNNPIQITILSLVEAVSVALGGEFKVYLPELIPQILRVFMRDTSERRTPTLKVLHALEVFGANLDDFIHLVIPPVVRLFEAADTLMDVRVTAIQTVGRLCRKLNFSDHASRIIHPLTRVLESTPELRGAALDALCALVFQLGADYAIFVPLVGQVLIRQRIQHARYDILVTKVLKNQPLPADDAGGEDHRGGSRQPALGDDGIEAGTIKKLHVHQVNLKRAWEASQRSTKEDWIEWIRRFSVELLRESPSPALRSCSALANVYHPLARELFNAAFMSCWTELYEQYQEELVRSLETALLSPNIPAEILQTLLNLAEYMEHDDKALPIDTSTLGEYASRCHAYAKALHYKEMEFYATQSPDAIEALISINNQLQQPEAAAGILTYAQQNHDLELTIHESWYEKLQQWDEALEVYDRKQREDPLNMALAVGRMRCLHALGNWADLHALAQDKWRVADEATRHAIAPMAAAAAWGLGRWDAMDDYLGAMGREMQEGAFFRAILAVHRSQFAAAQQHIDAARDILDAELTALAGESYNRAYGVMVRVQMLAELEEIVRVRCAQDRQAVLASVRQTWMARLRGCQRNVEVWQRILEVRSLVVPPQQEKDMWLKFASLCRKSGRQSLARKTLVTLLGTDPAEGDGAGLARLHTAHPRVAFAYMKHMAHNGEMPAAHALLRDFVRSSVPSAPASSDFDARAKARLLARCHLKLGEWQAALQDSLTDDAIAPILDAYAQATQLDPAWYKAWHAWALMNFEAVGYYEKVGGREDRMRAHLAPALQGFFRSIALLRGNSLQDTLRLLTLWFKYGYLAEVNDAVVEGIKTVSIDTWLQVIPQLIARIHTPSAMVGRLIHSLLADIGRQHPQALVYPLTVASKSQSAPRRSAALSIMDTMRHHSAELIEQALVVSEELIRVAILWHEMWHEGLEEASRLYFGEHNIEGMFAKLEPLHQRLEKGPETLREISFNQAFGRDLHEAHEWCKKYQRSGAINDVHQAWELYYLVFRRISKQLPQLTSLELQYVSPKLLGARDLELAVPGTYRSGEPVIRIASFVPQLNVISSKQRPRKLTVKGSDGLDYVYLLKGHEDLRQDERVMQLFGLVNTLLAADPETFKRHLSIQRYSVIPLSPNSGLIGWVPHCDTLHALIRDYRESRKILLNIEHRLMLQMAPDYDNLTLVQKVEVFRHALTNTTGQDLYKVLWLKSVNSESWLDRRTNYTRSLAVMSMVGYILGLGDRHPSNLMLDRFSGKILHIDFGDCFEVAMHREKFPERIPFRLTRMLINAMEVSGIEGNYRMTCESVMRVLRENKDSLMAVLEAFVYDPLINWRLIEGAGKSAPKKKGGIEPGADILEEGAAPFGARQKPRSESELLHSMESMGENKPEVLNERAVTVITRVQAKLTGRDFAPNEMLDVPTQVQRLIRQATSHENLCQCYIGWCPFW